MKALLKRTAAPVQREQERVLAQEQACSSIPGAHHQLRRECTPSTSAASRGQDALARIDVKVPSLPKLSHPFMKTQVIPRPSVLVHQPVALLLSEITSFESHRDEEWSFTRCAGLPILRDARCLMF